jgi:hypothetical protein
VQKRKIIAFVILIFFSFGKYFSQDTTIILKNTENIYSHQYKAQPKDKVVIEFIHCGWLNMPGGIKNDLPSHGMNFYLFFDKPLGNSSFSFAYGCGISSHNISGNCNIKYQKDSLGVLSTILEKRESFFKKNIIGAKFVEVPFELRFRSRSVNTLKLAIGFKIGYTIQNFRKIFDIEGKRKLYDIPNFNPWRYGIELKIGYERFFLCGFYSFTNLMNKSIQNTNIHSYSIGIGVTPF